MKRFLLLSVLICACGDDTDTETQSNEMAVEVWGETFIESGIPEDKFADGWAITFDRFLINLADISVAMDGEEAAISDTSTKIWDLTKTGPHQILSEEIPVGEYTHSAYRISPATDKSETGNAEDDDVDEMISGGYSVLIEGSATKDDETMTFSWGFETDTVYDPCNSIGHLTADEKGTVQITIHGDHLFYDDAVSEEPSLRFEDIALADEDDDGEVTLDELAAYETTPLDHYGVGSFDIDNMKDYIAHMTSTLGHIDGEEHCE